MAPVITRTARPGVTGTPGASPAQSVSATARNTGCSRLAPAVSAARRAYPSSGERSKGG